MDTLVMRSVWNSFRAPLKTTSNMVSLRPQSLLSSTICKAQQLKSKMHCWISITHSMYALIETKFLSGFNVYHHCTLYQSKALVQCLTLSHELTYLVEYKADQLLQLSGRADQNVCGILPLWCPRQTPGGVETLVSWRTAGAANAPLALQTAGRCHWYLGTLALRAVAPLLAPLATVLLLVGTAFIPRLFGAWRCACHHTKSHEVQLAYIIKYTTH